MVPKKRKSKLHRTVLRLSDLDHSKAAVLNALTSPESRRTYEYAIEQFIAWYCALGGTVTSSVGLRMENDLRFSTILQTLPTITPSDCSCSPWLPGTRFQSRLIAS